MHNNCDFTRQTCFVSYRHLHRSIEQSISIHLKRLLNSVVSVVSFNHSSRSKPFRKVAQLAGYSTKRSKRSPDVTRSGARRTRRPQAPKHGRVGRAFHGPEQQEELRRGQYLAG